MSAFDKLLSNRFPDNLILSHDLLEGNYLRCGYVSDIEFIDDFPSKFLTDTSRQHRWARGDVQIISWLGNKVRNKSGEKEKNPPLPAPSDEFYVCDEADILKDSTKKYIIEKNEIK